MKVLVIQKQKIGDVLTSTVIFEALREKYPSSELHYLVYPNTLAVIKNNPFIDKIIVLDNNTKNNLFSFIKFCLEIRKTKYDTIIDVYSKINSAVISKISGAAKTITFKKSYTKYFYSDTIERNMISFSNATKAIEHRIKLLEPLGIPFREINPKIYLSEEEKKHAKIKLSEANINLSKPIIMISAIGSIESKNYPLQYMAKLLDFICKSIDAQLLFNYIPFQKEEAQRLYDMCNSETKNKIFFDFYENDLRKFLAITSQCKALIGNEGGATNMAKALNIPTFTIYSPLILKNDWNMFENETTNISVHISDYLENNSDESIKKLFNTKNYKELYKLFTPDFFKDKLYNFINLNCS